MGQPEFRTVYFVQLFDFNGKLSPDGWDIYYITEWDYSKSTASGAKNGQKPSKKGVFISTSDHLSNFWRQQLLRPATFRASNFWGQQLLRSATFRANNFFPAFCRNHKALVIVLTGISWGLQILYCLMEFSTSAVGSIACKSAINAICNQRHLLVSI